MALDTLTQSMQEGDGKIIDLEYKNSELQRELQVARTTLADVRAALENAHNDVGALTQELTTVCAELASSGRPREKIVAVVDVLKQTGLSQDMQIECIKDIVTDPFGPPVRTSNPVHQRAWLRLVAVYNDAVKHRDLDFQTRNKISSFPKVKGQAVLMILVMVLCITCCAYYKRAPWATSAPATSFLDTV
ncbi:hypothetical protein FOMPIDRAFT_84470 [Fomitopsis schrenkii]|uniref:Uncharacterized protein n=1 Tax=Fomitopsis schrenkii TaxID=2126942 RepID=S8DV92_FOMSC|nr:hypothetical protein FOMPIDRAFT_84470 [Fomitopsis schrenkii]